MILSFRHKGLEVFYKTGSVRGIQPAHARKLGQILASLNNALIPEDMMLPSYRMHALKGNLKDHWSVWVNGNWRVTFRFVPGGVELVDYQDYHGK